MFFCTKSHHWERERNNHRRRKTVVLLIAWTLIFSFDYLHKWWRIFFSTTTQKIADNLFRLVCSKEILLTANRLKSNGSLSLSLALQNYWSTSNILIIFLFTSNSIAVYSNENQMLFFPSSAHFGHIFVNAIEPIKTNPNIDCNQIEKAHSWINTRRRFDLCSNDMHVAHDFFPSRNSSNQSKYLELSSLVMESIWHWCCFDV